MSHMDFVSAFCSSLAFITIIIFKKGKDIKTFSDDTWTSVSIQERLSQFLKESEGWGRKTTSVPGIFLLKLPSSKTGTRKEALAIEINPINPGTSSPTKKRGIVIRSVSELEQITKILTNPKMSELARKMDGINPTEVKSKAKSTDMLDIIEI
jgi:hypothetical protein